MPRVRVRRTREEHPYDGRDRVEQDTAVLSVVRDAVLAQSGEFVTRDVVDLMPGSLDGDRHTRRRNRTAAAYWLERMSRVGFLRMTGLTGDGGRRWIVIDGVDAPTRNEMRHEQTVPVRRPVSRREEILELLSDGEWHDCAQVSSELDMPYTSARTILLSLFRAGAAERRDNMRVKLRFEYRVVNPATD